MKAIERHRGVKPIKPCKHCHKYEQGFAFRCLKEFPFIRKVSDSPITLLLDSMGCTEDDFNICKYKERDDPNNQ
jgi:hypothetical protein